MVTQLLTLCFKHPIWVHIKHNTVSVFTSYVDVGWTGKNIVYGLMLKKYKILYSSEDTNGHIDIAMVMV